MPIYQELPKIDNPIFYSASAAVDYLFEKSVFYHEMECLTCSQSMHLNWNRGANGTFRCYTCNQEKSIRTHSWFSKHHFKVHNCLAVARRLIAGRFTATEWRQDYTLGWEAAKKIRDELFDLIEQDITHSLEGNKLFNI